MIGLVLGIRAQHNRNFKKHNVTYVPELGLYSFKYNFKTVLLKSELI